MHISLGPLGVLGVIFVLAKLFGYLSWSWLWVLAPFWIPLGVVALIIIGGFCLAVLASIFSE